MKTLLILGATLLGAAMFQLPSKPPMKMGLWEIETVIKMNIPDLPAGMPAMGPRSYRVRACMTPESYQKNLGANQQMHDCVRTNESWTGKGYSFDMACSKGRITGHFEMTFDGMEAGHGTSHMTMNGGKGSTSMDSTSSAKFVSSDCGAVTPDKPEILH